MKRRDFLKNIGLGTIGIAASASVIASTVSTKKKVLLSNTRVDSADSVSGYNFDFDYESVPEGNDYAITIECNGDSKEIVYDRIKKELVVIESKV